MAELHGWGCAALAAAPVEASTTRPPNTLERYAMDGYTHIRGKCASDPNLSHLTTIIYAETVTLPSPARIQS